MKHAVITGGAAGLGADVARTLSEAGYRIGIFDLGAERVAEAASKLENAVGIEADVTSPDQVAAAFDAFGEVPDLLVNNAGIVRFGAMEEQSVQDYIDVVNVNLLGSCFCARAIAPAMMDRGSGHIINFTSINGVHPAPGVGLYGPTKAAMANMTQAMAIEWGPKRYPRQRDCTGYDRCRYVQAHFREPQGARDARGRRATEMSGRSRGYCRSGPFSGLRWR